MLKKIGEACADRQIKIKDALFPVPFDQGLEYASPARGPWNIVHIGMLIPQAHQIFVCAQGCLRGVVLTAAEMGARRRFSMIEIRENNVLNGDMEKLITDGIDDILGKLKKLPPAVLVYTSCIHHFMACDLDLVYKQLRNKYPGVTFTDCYMNPIMRKSGLTPDQIMRKQLYSLLEPMKKNGKSVSILGNCFPMDESSDFMYILRRAGFRVKDITYCRTYRDYLDMAESDFFISTQPSVFAGGEELVKRIGGKHFYMPVSFDYEEIKKDLDAFSKTLGIENENCQEDQEMTEEAFKRAYEIIGDTPVVIDYTAISRPLGLARILASHGFNLTEIYADSFSGEEEKDFEWLRQYAPDVRLRPTADIEMRFVKRNHDEKILAIGEKAAYFTGTGYFVNMVENAGRYGFDGIRKILEDMIEAFLHEKDVKTQIQVKGLNCGCCL